jgi:hypothetical protein
MCHHNFDTSFVLVVIDFWVPYFFCCLCDRWNRHFGHKKKDVRKPRLAFQVGGGNNGRQPSQFFLPKNVTHFFVRLFSSEEEAGVMQFPAFLHTLGLPKWVDPSMMLFLAIGLPTFYIT